MPRRVADLLSADAVLLRREALERGVDDDALRRLVRAGVIVRIRQGAYVERTTWEGADDKTRQELLTTAVLRLYDACTADDVVLSHISAAVAYAAPVWGADLRVVHLTRTGSSGRRLARVVHHRAELGVEDLARHDGIWITSPARTVLDVARTAGTESGLVVANDLLRRGLTDTAELERAARRMAMWADTLGHHVLLRQADERLESVGEVRAAYLFWRQGLPAFEPQYDVRRPDGSLAGTVDFAWPEHGVIVEFDGMEKYTRYRRPGETLAETIAREKRREDEIRELTGWIVIRIVWADLARPAETAARIRAKLRTSRTPV